jgi:hypothetical protein
MPSKPRQQALTEPRSLVLIPPLAEEFSLYGGDDVVARARAWALDHQYLLADQVPSCAHGLYLLSDCPRSSCRRFSQLDHARLWVPARAVGEREQPFLLSHPYSDRIEDETRTYAEAHGLGVGSFPEFGDDWYGSGTVPIRLTVPDDWPLWPIEATAVILLDTQPVQWPDA